MRGSMSGITIDDAKRIFGGDMLGLAEVEAVFGGDVAASLTREQPVSIAELSFDRDTLMRAADEGMMLVLRTAGDASGDRLTVVSLAARFPGTRPASGEDPWFVRERFASGDVCAAGWALVDKDPRSETRNLSYVEQDAALARRSERLGFALRRRTAVEIVYDTLLYAASRSERLLETGWDWSSTMTLDGGAVTAGQFDDAGLRLLAYSKAVRFDSLGVCATFDASARR
jgi:hypothetical protein